MTHPIPGPRPSSDPLHRSFPTLPQRGPLVGPFCPMCTHTSCRRRRAQELPRLGGRLAEYAREHSEAAAAQRRHPNVIVWFGESTGSFWVASSTGLAEVPDTAPLNRLLAPDPVHA